MTKPFLFIETPRAGRHNHRFIAPNDYTGNDELLSHFADSARQQPEGTNFVAAGTQAKQQISGRTGWEQIILAGVNVNRLSIKQITSVHEFLEQQLPDVEQLVTKTINWNETTQVVVLRAELNQWLQQLEIQIGTLPKAPDVVMPMVKPSQATKIKSRWRTIMETTSLGILLVLGMIAIVPYFYSKPNQPSTQTVMELHTAQIRIKRLVDAIGGKDAVAVINEINTVAHLPNMNEKNFLNTWRGSNLNQNIPEKGNNWPLSLFLANLTNNGRDLTQWLWGKALNKLAIKHGNGALQPLVECRQAIRNLLLNNPHEVYTPFLQNEDFKASVANLKERVTQWPHPDAIKGKKNCNIEPDKNESMLAWINRCIKPIDGFAEDKELSKIKKVGVACGEIAFTAPIAPNIGSIKK